MILTISSDILAALCAGLAVVLVSAALAHRQDSAWLGVRLRSFVEAAAGHGVTAARPSTRRNVLTRAALQFPGWTGLGIQEITLLQADMIVSPHRFMGMQALSAAVSVLLGFLFSIRTGIEGMFLPLVLVAMAWVGIRIPRWVVMFRRSRRLEIGRAHV